MDKLLTLDDKTYILKDLLLTKDSGRAINRLCKKYKCIDGEIKQLQRATMFREGYVVCSVYVPRDDWQKFEDELEAIGDGSNSGSSGMMWVVMVVTVVAVGAVVYYFFFKGLAEKMKKKDSRWSRLKVKLKKFGNWLMFWKETKNENEPFNEPLK